MDILITLTPVILIGVLLLFWITMLVHAVRSRIQNKLLWVLLLIFTNVLGGIIYYAVIYRKVAKINKSLIKFLSVGALILVAIILISIFTESRRQSPKIEEVSFTKVTDYNTAGQIKRIEVKGDELTVTLKDASKPTLHSKKPPGTSLYDHGISPEEIEVIIKPTR